MYSMLMIIWYLGLKITFIDFWGLLCNFFFFFLGIILVNMEALFLMAIYGRYVFQSLNVKSISILLLLLIS